MSVPDCVYCKFNTTDGCEQAQARFPHAWNCTAFISRASSVTPPTITKGEYKVMSESTPTKCLKYALFP